MRKQFDPKQNDFLDFKNGEPVAPPLHLTEKIIGQVHSDLNPNPWKVFSKLSLIHFIVGLVTLSICPQFGFRIFGTGAGLMGAFMALGPYACGLACGSFFLGSSILVASLVFTPEELRQLRKNEFLAVSSLALMSMGFFIMLDTEVVLGFALAWLLGSMMAGMTLVEIIFALRIRARIR